MMALRRPTLVGAGVVAATRTPARQTVVRAVSTARGPEMGRGANRNTKNAVDRWYNHLLIFILTLLLHLLSKLHTLDAGSGGSDGRKETEIS